MCMGSPTTVIHTRTGQSAKGYYSCVFVSLSALESERGAQQRKALLSVIAVVVVEWFHLFCVFITLIVCARVCVCRGLRWLFIHIFAHTHSESELMRSGPFYSPSAGATLI